jgi:hypothetical protein
LARLKLPGVPISWPRIDEPELLERLALDDSEFAAYVASLIAALPARAYEAASLAQALAYPWARPTGSYLLRGSRVSLLAAMAPDERERAIAGFIAAGGGRLPVLAIGSNAAPDVLERKFGHFPDEEDRAALALTGRLREFDVGVAAQPALYGAMPATLFPSPGTAVSAAVLWVTPAQFTQLAWSEISYRLGALRTRFEVEEADTVLEEVLAFVSRFGAFCVDGEPVALAAVPAAGRSARELTQEQVLDAAAALALGPGATAEALVRAMIEEPVALAPKVIATVNRASQPFISNRWTPFGGG